MLKISDPKKAGSAAWYYLNCYLREPNGQAFWQGVGAAQLELNPNLEERPKINQREFQYVMHGFNYDGKYNLATNAGDKNRTAFWVLDFKVPKSFMVAYSAGTQSVRVEMDRAIIAALTKTLSVVEKKLGFSWGDQGGIYPANLAFALFRAPSSHEDQPSPQWHCLLLNMGVLRNGGSIGALHIKPILEAKRQLGAFFRHELRREADERLGLITQKEAHEFHLLGEPKEIYEANSKRREHIKDFLNTQRSLLGFRGLTEIKTAKLRAVERSEPKTRENQLELLTKWQHKSLAAGWGWGQVEELLGATFTNEQKRDLSAPASKNGGLVTQLKGEMLASEFKCGAIPYDEWLRGVNGKYRIRKSLSLIHGGQSPVNGGAGTQKIEVRPQDQNHFPKVPGWNPISKLIIKALDFVRHRENADIKITEIVKETKKLELIKPAKKHKQPHL